MVVSHKKAVRSKVNFGRIEKLFFMGRKLSPTSVSLLRFAGISTPILALLWGAPMILVSDAIFEESILATSTHYWILATMVVGFAIQVFAQWCLNIYLLRYLVRNQEVSLLEKVGRYLLILGGSFALMYVVITILRGSWGGNILIKMPTAAVHPYIVAMANNLLMLLVIHLFSTREKATKLLVDNAELQVTNIKIMQHQLQQQLQPHFLFNALYNLQLLIDDAPERAKDYVSKLSSFLRASVDYGKLETVVTEGEIEFFRNYMDLQAMRFGKKIAYEIDLPEIIHQQTKIPVFSLQILAENAVKHNTFSSSQPLLIKITHLNNQQLKFSNVKSKKYRTDQPRTGTGLNNLRQRYELLGLTGFDVQETETDFSVTLPLLAA